MIWNINILKIPRTFWKLLKAPEEKKKVLECSRVLNFLYIPDLLEVSGRSRKKMQYYETSSYFWHNVPIGTKHASQNFVEIAESFRKKEERSGMFWIIKLL